MTWTAPHVTRPGGSLNAPEPEMLRGMLDYYRATLLFKCAGLTGEQLALRSVPGSSLSLLGLLRHLAKVERIWFRRRFRSEWVPMLYSTPEHRDADFDDLDPAQAQAAYELLVEESELARKAVEGESLDSVFIDDDGDEISLRFVFTHMIAEYARHDGHADLLRQGIDGVTGA
ncbi:putative damage-inducible protein DinB [Allocatelliglobosispora scoriae]|uniref:Putative damage-inducible protein DinB n=1 Tax=Allocatelliglobosispora scoriae TaxID=643052 RepID=A0A841C5S5_9ACTN|nr:DinB family protein [Allocatelliglobosispora scoriae]MBB5874422.1 putative damage-inducible protein DinB [Allocatelliglobosispora scoriae]